MLYLDYSLVINRTHPYILQLEEKDDNLINFDNYYSDCHVKLKEEIREWLDDVVGNDNWQEVDAGVDGYWINLEFKNEEHVSLFKITWC